MCPRTGHCIGEETDGVLEVLESADARKPLMNRGSEPDVQFVAGPVIDLWRVSSLEAQMERLVGYLDSLAKRRDSVLDETTDQCEQTVAFSGLLIYTAQGAGTKFQKTVGSVVICSAVFCLHRVGDAECKHFVVGM